MRLGLEAGQATQDAATELGIRGVPVSMERLVNEGPDAVVASLAARGLEVCQVGAFGYNPLSTDRGRQAQQRALIEQAIPLAPKTGCRYLVICGGNHHPSGFAAADPRNFGDDALRAVAADLAPLVALAERSGACLCIEPYLKTAVSSPERFLALKRLVPSDALRVNVDVTSFYDFADLIDPRDKVRHVCAALAGHYGLGHVKEIALAEGFHIHCGLAPLGTGRTDWTQVLALMAPHLPADGWLILEHVADAGEARASVARLREAARAAGVELT
jgi:sugar phosphate isomerase/epimerase